VPYDCSGKAAPTSENTNHGSISFSFVVIRPHWEDASFPVVSRTSNNFMFVTNNVFITHPLNTNGIRRSDLTYSNIGSCLHCCRTRLCGDAATSRRASWRDSQNAIAMRSCRTGTCSEKERSYACERLTAGEGGQVTDQHTLPIGELVRDTSENKSPVLLMYGGI